MQNLLKVVLVTCLFVLIAPLLAKADGAMPPAIKSSPEFQKIKNLAGRWSTVNSIFGKNQKMFVDYKVTADGSAVLESIFPGTPQEMISVYYDDNHGKLAMTHYCIMHTRTTMALAKSDDNSVTFKVAKVEGPKSDHQMGGATYTFKDANHMTQTCDGKDEKGKSHTMTLDYTRVK